MSSVSLAKYSIKNYIRNFTPVKHIIVKFFPEKKRFPFLLIIHNFKKAS